MNKNFVIIDKYTPRQSHIELESVDITKVRFTTESILVDQSHTYRIKNGILYDRNNFVFQFNGPLKMEATIEDKNLKCYFCFNAYFVKGKLYESIKLLNFTMHFKREKRCMLELIQSKIKKIKCMIWKK